MVALFYLLVVTLFDLLWTLIDLLLVTLFDFLSCLRRAPAARPRDPRGRLLAEAPGCHPRNAERWQMATVNLQDRSSLVPPSTTLYSLFSSRGYGRKDLTSSLGRSSRIGTVKRGTVPRRGCLSLSSI